jgi:hypothetical protein
MSKIWDALRELERLKKKRISEETLWHEYGLIHDRRCARRFLANVSVWAYGYGAADDPFYEQGEALSVNAGGGIILLTTAVNPGQPLLLLNEENLKEEKCTVVRQVSTVLNQSGIVVKFPQPIPDFWVTTHS